jgi:protein-tyrosine phosphatase
VSATRVLYVCTANRCRSPFAEQILRRALGAAPVEVVSAGFLAGGQPVPRVGLAVAAERALPLGAHRSRRIDELAPGAFDLILTMERGQARELVAEDPDLAPRVFTVKQFDRWSAAHAFPGAGDGPSGALGAWLDEVAADRSPRELLGADPRDDVADPLTEPAPAWRAMADAFELHAGALVRWLQGHGAHGADLPGAASAAPASGSPSSTAAS